MALLLFMLTAACSVDSNEVEEQELPLNTAATDALFPSGNAEIEEPGTPFAPPEDKVNALPSASLEEPATMEPIPALDFRLAPSNTSESPYLVFNEQWLAGLADKSLDLTDIDAVFWRVFSGLDDEVTIYPSENYYYYSMYVDGKQIWGNIRLPAGRREHGVLSFAYFEFKESPFETGSRLSRSKYFLDRDGLTIEEIDPFQYIVRYSGKEVTFHLHRLRQDPPELWTVDENEVFIQRTFDESGYQFFLIYDENSDHFLWVLNEEESVPDILEPVSETDDLVIGRRSGFAFWVDAAHGDRKVMIAIRGQSAVRNDYYDGPFDQLADNYVDEVRVSDYIVRASPSLEGRIDKYGYFTDRESGRVSISPYYVYFTMTSLRGFFAEAKAQEDPYAFIARGRRAS
jgi:hypothetical protein